MDLEKKVKETIEKYNLISKKDKVVVALSGGKDSTSLLYILHKLGYNVHGLMIDLDLGEWSKTHNKNMKEFCTGLGIPLTIVELKKEFGHGICYIKAIVKKQKNVTGCTICGIIKKYILNKWAKKLGADKIATGHNLDDETQTVLMNFLKGNVMLGANSSPATGITGEMPKDKDKFHSDNKSLFAPKDLINSMSRQANSYKNKVLSSSELKASEMGFVQRIKPLFFVPESEIRKYSKKMKFNILYDKCPCAIGTYRVETRAWLSSIPDSQKLKIVENFQKIIPKIKKENACSPKECKMCGEPARNEVCNACKILECFKF